LSGQPPEPLWDWMKFIEYWSMSGRVSRSTLTQMKFSFKKEAVAGSENASAAMTWHQWQVE